MEFSAEHINKLVYELSVNNSQLALRQLYMMFYSKLLLFSSYYVRSESIAEEVVSDTFISIWERRAQLSGIHNFKSYVYGIAKNLSISYLRKESERMNDVDIAHLDTVLKTSENPETEFISTEIMNRLNEAIESLPEKCKLAFKLIREHDMKYKEAAQVLEISVKTLEAHVALAVKRLRGALSQDLKIS